MLTKLFKNFSGDADDKVILQVSAETLREVVNDMYQQIEEKARQEAAERSEQGALSRRQVMELLGVNSTTLWRWDRDGYLKPVRIGAKVLYKRSDIDRLLSNKEEKGGEL